ncbi:hypothetical protein C4588_02760 [Candidatus Parcubacteria bacterium]|nr:MAG: hypothetical protein C4588_02760 [Candidatus Parcubacteria bacterium]
MTQVDSLTEDPPGSTRWIAKAAQHINSEITPLQDSITIPVLIVGSEPWSASDDAETLWPLREGIKHLSATAGKIILGTIKCGPAPAWAAERKSFKLAESVEYIPNYGVVRTCYIAESGLWPAVSTKLVA